MNTADPVAFRRMCAQYRWLAVFMVASVGGLMTLMHVIAPLGLVLGGQRRHLPLWLPEAIWAAPAAFYLFAVWSIGAAMGQLARGRMIQPTLSDALRRVGLALGFGGLIAVFGVTNMMRFLGDGRASWANFDVPGMTLGMIGGALFLLGRVIDQAGRVQAELDEMI